MKTRIYLYHLTRVIFGALLVLYGTYNVIRYSEFLERLDIYFGNVTVFNIGFIEALAPLVPFEEFLIGLFLVLGVFTRKTLIVTSILFAFFTLFLWDANSSYRAGAHLISFLITIVLIIGNTYDRNTIRYHKDSYQIIHKI
ncbi:DoxX family membrane protein [Aquimarina sp. AU58]|uniref:DoxX family membrane protein n=1 Tax=Aquimarina sp. AU58 TaxID=1874112 RepID=UPI001358C3D2|nr:DoxX family membrane protein [Aquimarina sp. AU58]